MRKASELMSNEFQNTMALNTSIRSGPSYLIILDNGKTDELFLATKFDEIGSCIKATGFYTNKNEGATELLSKMKKTSMESPEIFIEVFFPWHRIKSIKNLIFKFKGVL